MICTRRGLFVKWLLLGGLLLGPVLACQSLKHAFEDDQPEASAQFGVFFGGQIQERNEIPFELDAGKQTHGFRVLLKAPTNKPRTISWQLSPPGPQPKANAPTPAPAAGAKGSALLGIGQREISEVWSFHPGDPLGLWNIRVTLDQQVLIDRSFMVYDAEGRAKVNRKTDAGSR